VHPRDDELGSESGCRETDTANVLTLLMQMGGIRLCTQKPSDTIRGTEIRASEEGGNKLENGSGCRETDTVDVLTLQMQVGGIRLCPKAIRYDQGG